MIEYPKIETLYERDKDTFKVIPSELRKDEFGLVNNWLVTEKIDGTNIRVHYTYETGSDEIACAKCGGALPSSVATSVNLGWQCPKCERWNNWSSRAPVPPDSDDFIETLRFGGRTDRAQVPTDLFAHLQDTFDPDDFRDIFVDPEDDKIEVTLFGEGYGPKIQSGGWYRDTPSFRLFDVRVGEWWLNWKNVEDVAEKFGIQTVPVLNRSTTLGLAARLASNCPSVTAMNESGDGSRFHEGVVCRTDPLLFDRAGKRLMWKLKGKDFA